jgi:hypothetical protein
VTVEVGQSKVEDDEVRAVLHRLPKPRQRRTGRADRVAALVQRPDQGAADPFVVLDDQEMGHGADASVPTTSSTRTETDP